MNQFDLVQNICFAILPIAFFIGLAVNHGSVRALRDEIDGLRENRNYVYRENDTLKATRNYYRTCLSLLRLHFGKRSITEIESIEIERKIAEILKGEI